MTNYNLYGACGRCGAPPGQPCLTKSGEVATRKHSIRPPVDSPVYPGTPENDFTSHGQLQIVSPDVFHSMCTVDRPCDEPWCQPIPMPVPKPEFWDKYDTWHRRIARKEHGTKTKIRRKLARWNRYHTKVYGPWPDCGRVSPRYKRLCNRLVIEHDRQMSMRSDWA